MAPAATAATDNATAIAASDYGRVLAQRERRFAAALLAPAFLALMATTTFPLLFLVWTSAFRMDLAIIGRTVRDVVAARGISQPGRATVDYFQGNAGLDG